MSSESVRAGRAFVEFFIQDDSVNPALDRIQKGLLKFGAVATAMSAPVVAAFAKALTTFVSVGSELEDLHRRTGLSAESLSELSFAAQQSGTDLGVVERAIKELQSRGVDPRKFDEIAESLAAIPDHTKRAAAAIHQFGKKSGVELLPLLEDLQSLRAAVRKLGVVMSAEDVAAADKLGDTWGASRAQLTALMEIGAAIAGPLTDFLEWSQGVLKSTIDFIKAHPHLVQAAAAVAASLAVLGSAAIAASAAISVVSAAVGVLSGLSAALLIEWAPIVLVVGAVAIAAWEIVDAIATAVDWVNKLENALTDLVWQPIESLWEGIKATFGFEGQMMQSQLSDSLAGATVNNFSATELSAIAASGGFHGGSNDVFGQQIAFNTGELLRFFKNGGGKLRAGAI